MLFTRFSKILVVDDSALSRKILRTMLARIGHDNVEEASSGRAAIAMLSQQSFRLVISDWDMEPMNGLDLLKAMRCSQSLMRVPFIMMTAHAQKKFVEIARDNGATLYLAKPFTVDVLADRIAGIGRLNVA